MVNVFWDANFVLKALTPSGVDAQGNFSPQAITNAGVAPLQMNVDGSTKAITLYRDPAQSSSKITIAFWDITFINWAAAEAAILATTGNIAGTITYNLEDGPLQIPLEGITYIGITNNESASRNISFLLLNSPA